MFAHPTSELPTVHCHALVAQRRSDPATRIALELVIDRTDRAIRMSASSATEAVSQKVERESPISLHLQATETQEAGDDTGVRAFWTGSMLQGPP